MTELAVIEPSAPALDIGAWGDALLFADKVSLAVSDTEFVPAPLRGRREAVTALILYGMEIGVTPMQALQGMHIVDGRPAPSAELMRALIYKAGHNVTVHEATGTRCRVSGLRHGRPESERLHIEWTIDQARAAGLLGRKNWQTYPRAMLTARATGDLARMLFPDVIKGLGYVAEDGAEPDAGIWGAPEELAPATKPRKALQRKPRRVRDDDPAPVEDVELPETAAREPDRPPVAPVASREPLEPRAPAPTRVAPEDRELPFDDETPAAASARTLPAVEPERPAPEPPPPSGGSGPPPLGLAPMRALQAGLTRELGTVATPAERHALCSAILGREIVTTKELTRSEGLRVLDALGRMANGSLTFEADAEALPEIRFKIYDTRPESERD